MLVGGGDVTLSRTPSGTSTAYAGAAHLDDLADQVKAAWNADPATAGSPITTVILDSSYFSGDAWQPSWDRKELTDGYMPPITALMVDGDRDNPASNVSARSDDPVGSARDPPSLPRLAARRQRSAPLQPELACSARSHPRPSRPWSTRP